MCARGEWATGGSPKPGFDAYATSKQCELAAGIGQDTIHRQVRTITFEDARGCAANLGWVSYRKNAKGTKWK
jgi:hypothetical protein